jgi:hypothetical protein
MWVGSVIGGALADDNNLSVDKQIVEFPSSHWITSRNEIAKILIKAEKLEVNYISAEIVKILSNNSSSVNIPTNQKCLISLLEYHNTFLSLLPLIIFWGNNQDLLTAIITQCNVKATHATEIEEDILIWSYLLTLVSNQPLDSQTLNVGLIVKQILAGIKVGTTSLIEKLEIVNQGWEQGITWQQLTEKLLNKGNWGQIAIALSIYCFGCTPHDFRVASRRAANLNYNLARVTTALTATISGAYNGMTGIPWSWKSTANNDQTDQQVKLVGRELWQSWLGIYSDNEQQFLYDEQLHAVALPNTIQPRKALKIISQKLHSS